MSHERFRFIAGRLAVGNIAAAMLPGWAWIVTCCPEEEIGQGGFCDRVIDSRYQTYIPFKDGQELPTQMQAWLPSTRGHIRQGLAKGCVLIHCGAGESRSVFVAMDYLMDCLGLTTSEALGMVRRNHPTAAPAEVFLRYLSRTHKVEELSATGPRM